MIAVIGWTGLCDYTPDEVKDMLDQAIAALKKPVVKPRRASIKGQPRTCWQTVAHAANNQGGKLLSGWSILDVEKTSAEEPLRMAHGSDASKLIRVKHTKDVLENLASIREVMDLANQQFEATAEQYRLLARKSINGSDLRKYVQRVLKIDEETNPSTRITNIAEEIVGLAEAGRGNDLPSVRDTLWTAYNGVAEYLGYNRGRSGDNRLNSLWFGDSAATNRHALEVALNMAA